MKERKTNYFPMQNNLFEMRGGVGTECRDSTTFTQKLGRQIVDECGGKARKQQKTSRSVLCQCRLRLRI